MRLNPSLTLIGFRTTRPLVEKGTVRVKYLTQEHNKIILARAQKSQTAWSGDENTNHEATAHLPWKLQTKVLFNIVIDRSSSNRWQISLIRNNKATSAGKRSRRQSICECQLSFLKLTMN